MDSQSDVEPTGYAAHAYAESLAEFGRPRRLPTCGGSIIERRVPRLDDVDAIGPYPLFACEDWSGLERDLTQLEGRLVSVSVVTDPFGEYALADLERTFSDRAFAFKDHFVTDLSQSREDIVHAHHRRNARKALRQVEVEVCADPAALLDGWHALYENLIRRHGIKGIAAFSRGSFSNQLRVPGITALRAMQGRETVGMTLWYRRQDVAYYHLGAYSEGGYRLGASFAIFWTALAHFAESGIAWLNLGAGAGLDGSGTDGLSRFKRGWSTGTRTAYFCGRILSPDRYQAAIVATSAPTTDFFPAYRYGEFT